MITALENAGDTIIYTNCHNGDCTGLSDSVIALKIQNGAKHLYTEYEYGGHAIWDQAYNNFLLLQWVFMQSKATIFTEVGMKNYSSLPKKPVLYQNYPNPFNPSTIIRFDLPDIESQYIVSLQIYDLLGREVAKLTDGQKPAGTYKFQWNTAGLPSGVYFYKLSAVPTATQSFVPINSQDEQSAMFTETKKLILLK